MSEVHGDVGGVLGGDVGSQGTPPPASGDVQQGQQQGTPPAGGSAGGGASEQAFSFRGLIGDDGKFAANYAEELAKAHPELAEAKGLLAKYQDPLSLVKSLHHANQLASRKLANLDDLLNPTDERGVAMKREKLGIPQTAEGYELRPIEKLGDKEVPEGLRASKEDLAEFSKFAHEAGLSKQQAQALAQFDAARQVQMHEMQVQKEAVQQQQAIVQNVQVLKQELGRDYDRSMDLVVRLLESNGMNREQIATLKPLGDLGLVKTLVKIAQQSASDALPSNSGTSAGLDAGAQARDVIHNAQNPLHKAYHNGQAEAVERVQGLLRQEFEAKKRL